MRRSIAPSLVGTVAVLAAGHSAWAQAGQAAQPAATEMGTPLICMLFLPALVLGLFAYSIVASRKTLRTTVGQVDRSLTMAEETLKLSREQLALQKETNRLLAELVDKFRRPE